MNPPPPRTEAQLTKAAAKAAAAKAAAKAAKRQRGGTGKPAEADSAGDAVCKFADLHWQRRAFSEAWLALLRLPLAQV
jgi:hypothetical protein